MYIRISFALLRILLKMTRQLKSMLEIYRNSSNRNDVVKSQKWYSTKNSK